MLYKNLLLKIFKSLGRYISLMIIVAVGAGFYAGLAATPADIIGVADGYYKDSRLMDFKIVSTMGLTGADIDALEKIYGTVEVIGSYSLDLRDGEGNILRVHALEKGVNTINLTEGRMPENAKECVADSRKYALGDVIIIDDDVEGKLGYTEFTAVGLTESALYVNGYGSTSVGSGKLYSFIFVSKDCFTLEAYTEIYVTAEAGGAQAYSEEYDELAEKIKAELEGLKPKRETARYEEIHGEAMGEIGKNEKKLNKEKSKGEAELDDAGDTLDKNAKELSDGKRDGAKKLADARAELDSGMEELRKGKKELAENEKLYEKNKKEREKEFEAAQKSIAQGWQEIDAALFKAGGSRDSVGAAVSGLEANIESIKAQLEYLPADSPEYAKLNGAVTEYSKQLEGLKQLKSSVDDLNAQEKTLNDGIKFFNAEMAKAKKELESAKKTIAANEKKIDKGYGEYNKNLQKFNSEMAENQKKLDDGYAEYYENLELFNDEIADGMKKINDAKEELSKLEKPKWYIFNRNAAAGYGDLDSIISVIRTLSKIFPLLFILIAMLMASSAMSRMIAEERGELGTLTSLGYTDGKIIFTYMLYVLSASGLGAVLGFFLGCRFIPPLVYVNITYSLPPLVMRYDFAVLGLILAVTLALMAAVTFISCNKELKHRPAYLMRPLPPRRGQKILLESVGFIWKRLSFTWKVTMRNMFRYKKRAFMTIVGVAACSALLLIAFGLRDGMGGITQRQYGDLYKYGSMIVLDGETDTLEGDLKKLFEKEEVTDALLAKQGELTCEKDGKTAELSLLVPQDDELFAKHFKLLGRDDKKSVVLEDGGAVITQRMARILKIKAGDTITVTDADNESYELKVAAIAENYAGDCVYMTTAMYEEVYGKAAVFNTVFANIGDGANEEKTAGDLTGSGLAVSVMFTSELMERTQGMIGNLKGAVIMVIVIASLLALVVLYNLTAINISERTREIATIKVLGFHDGETNAYIFREALILTLISTAVGLVLGVFLHSYMVDIIEAGAITLFKKIEWFSFVLSFAITMVFSGFIQILTYFKLKKIDMIESLKSVE